MLPYERKFPQSVEDIFNVDERHPVEFDNIKSKRVKSLIEAMCLPKGNLNSQTIANMNKLIVMAETPYKKGGQLVFLSLNWSKLKIDLILNLQSALFKSTKQEEILMVTVVDYKPLDNISGFQILTDNNQNFWLGIISNTNFRLGLKDLFLNQEFVFMTFYAQFALIKSFRLRMR